MPRPKERTTADLQAETTTNVPHKPERGVSISTIKERLIELRKNGQPKKRDGNASKHRRGPG
ncbi:hypothetical protein ABIB90_007489 [Bradyrhizobium sp. JR4.1]|uniref:hypothetical protein n=1 Tax=unclassified Bradyrhizobium TaxID=2631580 RepID=UPI00025D1365|nr:hypothetical protein [Bradyrhizobium sp. WSM1253]EIG56997.1 hypothetical protein Bra1253DRAFT_01635 [Bradyrhizobium sp. WSM1253]